MQIKKILAPSLKEAIEKMKKELGDESIVLSTRVIEADPQLSRKKMFEVTAGVETDSRQSAAPKQSEKKLNFDEELRNLTQKIYKAKQEKGLEKDFSNKKTVSDNSFDFNEIEEMLIQREVEEPYVNNIINQLKKYNAFLKNDNIDSYVVSTIGSMIPTSKFEVRKNNKPQIISLVGPTGVGKTTCIAKLAVISKILHNLDIGLITIDTYRLGALDQLKIFSEVSNIDLLVAYEPSELAKMVEKFKKKDIVFIDTVGRSQKNEQLLQEINKFLNIVNVDETYLVLNSTSTTKTLLDVAKSFRIFNYNGFVFTKLDEAVSFGNILNLVSATNIPVKYLTNGQVIPDDIISADPEFIANLIYTGNISE